MPRWPKSFRTVLPEGEVLLDRVSVKFLDGTKLRVRGGLLIAADSRGETIAAQQRVLNVVSQFATPQAGKFSASFGENETYYAQQEALAKKNLFLKLPDLGTHMEITFPALKSRQDIAALVDALNALDEVETAIPISSKSRPPAAFCDANPGGTNFTFCQGYRLAPDIVGGNFNGSGGINSEWLWSGAPHALPGRDGAGVKIVDVEFGWQLPHADLPLPVTPPVNGNAAYGTTNDAFAQVSHGNAVIGIMLAKRDSVGITGISPGATYDIVGSWSTNPPSAIQTAGTLVSAGDVVLLEMQEPPANDLGVQRRVGFCDLGDGPIEYRSTAHRDSILTLAAQNKVVVQAGGNGGYNLDSFWQGNRWFFDSGAIMVGARHIGNGVPPGQDPRYANDIDGHTSCSSTAGARMDLSAWGQRVTTTATPGNYFFTFNGTSAASPMIAGSAALVQAIYKAQKPGQYLLPWEIRWLLKRTGTPQGGGDYIGPMPNIERAVKDMDWDGDGLTYGEEIEEGTAHDAKDNDMFNTGTTGNRRFARMAYHDVLGRTASSPEWNAWWANLNGGWLRAQVIKAFIDSLEHQLYEASMTRLYSGILWRLPDYGGYRYWLDQRVKASSTPMWVIAQNFYWSGEGAAIWGTDANTNNTQFVDKLFANFCINANPNVGPCYYPAAPANTKAFWINQLNAGLPRGSALWQFTDSPSYKTAAYNHAFIVSAWTSLFRNGPTVADFTYWLNYLNATGDYHGFINAILGSPGYRSRFCNGC